MGNICSLTDAASTVMLMPISEIILHQNNAYIINNPMPNYQIHKAHHIFKLLRPSPFMHKVHSVVTDQKDPSKKLSVSFAGLFVSIFLLFSGFVIYPSNIPTYWKWLLYVNPIHWANVSFCRFQFKEGYRESCSNYLGQLPFCDQFPTMTVGKAYLAFYELSEYAERTWLPYVILLGWTFIANFLALLGLKNIEFAGTSQSLPYLKRYPIISKYRDHSGSESPIISNYRDNSDRGSQSYNSFSFNSSASKYSGPQNSGTGYGNTKENGRVERWIKEFRINLDANGLGIPVEPVTLLFEGLSFTRCALLSI